MCYIRKKMSSIGIGYHKIKFGGKMVRMYPDSGASMTIAPKSLLSKLGYGSSKRSACRTVLSTLNGSRTRMPVYRIPVKLGRVGPKMISVAASDLEGDVVWMGYPHLLDVFGVRYIDLKKPVKSKYRRFKAPLNLCPSR